MPQQLFPVAGRYGGQDLLPLDELGHVQVDPRGAEVLFQVIAEREERASIAIPYDIHREITTLSVRP